MSTHRALLYAAAAIVAGGGAGPVRAADMALVSAFRSACLEQLPDFKGTEAVLKAAGYELYPYGDGEFEFAHGTNGLSGAFGASSGCTVMREGLSQKDAQILGKQIVQDTFGKEPTLWRYDGAPAGWTVPHDGRVLYVIFNEGGLSADLRDQ